MSQHLIVLLRASFSVALHIFTCPHRLVQQHVCYHETVIHNDNVAWSMAVNKLHHCLCGLRGQNTASAQKQKSLTNYYFKYIDTPFCLRTDDREKRRIQECHQIESYMGFSFLPI